MPTVVVAPYAAPVHDPSLGTYVETGDWSSLSDRLSAMTPEEVIDARRWYHRTGAAQARRAAGSSMDEGFRATQIMLAVSLSETPEDASRRCEWSKGFLCIETPAALATCADRLLSHDRDWAEAFVGAAAATTGLRPQSARFREIAALTSALVSTHALKPPTTSTFVTGWASLITSAHLKSMWKSDAEWTVPTMLCSRNGRAVRAYEPGEELSLVECLRALQPVTELIVAALESPNALAEWSAFSEENWQIVPSVRTLVADRTLDRSAVLEHALGALTRDDRAANQRVVTDFLMAVDPTPAEILERIALLVHVFATVNGSVTKRLLPLMLSSGMDDDDLLAVGTLILARPEKAQKKVLLNHLTTADGSARAVLLELAAASDDAALATTASKLLSPRYTSNGRGPKREGTASDASTLGSRPTACLDGQPVWSNATRPFRPAPFTPFEPTDAGFDQAMSDLATYSRATSEAAVLDMVVRFAHRDLAGLRAVVTQGRVPNVYSEVRTPYLLHQWFTSGVGLRSYERTSYSYTWGPDGPSEPEEHTATVIPGGHVQFSDQLVAETLQRLGALSELLSTPSRANGTIEVGELAERVRRAGSVGYGQYDLVQALLRLEPTDPADARLFAGVRLRPWDPGSPTRSRLPFRRHGADRRDGADVIRAWIGAGGRGERRVDVVDGAPRISELVLPLPEWLRSIDGLADICSAQHRDSLRFSSDEPGPWLGVCPWDVEKWAARVAGIDPASVVHGQYLLLMVQAPGPMGAAIHHEVARILAHPRVDTRLVGATHAARLANTGRLQADLLRDRTMALVASGELALARAAHGWSALAAQSSLSVVWPTWRSVLDIACASEKRPTGLADLLRVTRQHAPVLISVDEVSLPKSVWTLARQRSATKAVLEARELLRACGQEESA